MDPLEHIKKSAVIKRSIHINGHKTSISLKTNFGAVCMMLAALRTRR